MSTVTLIELLQSQSFYNCILFPGMAYFLFYDSSNAPNLGTDIMSPLELKLTFTVVIEK